MPGMGMRLHWALGLGKGGARLTAIWAGEKPGLHYERDPVFYASSEMDPEMP